MFADNHLREFIKCFALQGNSWPGHSAGEWAAFVARNYHRVNAA